MNEALDCWEPILCLVLSRHCAFRKQFLREFVTLLHYQFLRTKVLMPITRTEEMMRSICSKLERIMPWSIRGVHRDSKLQLLNMIIAENDDLLVINKPPGLNVQGGSRVVLSLNDMVSQFVQFRDSSKQVHLLHRLDRDTSGIVLFAKSKQSAAYYSAQFQARKMHKRYLAIVHGILREKQGVLDFPLSLHKIGAIDRICVDVENGKKALTTFRVKAEHKSNKYSLLEMSPETGRKHQLRVHMSHINHSIVGDPKYGLHMYHNTKDGGSLPPLCLHAQYISFLDRTGNEMQYSAPCPAHFQSWFVQSILES